MVSLDDSFSSVGARLRFADSGGTGRAVVLTHGAGMDHHSFDAQADALSAAGLRVVVWDLRGHGGADRVPITAELLLRDIRGLVDHLGLDSPALVGHSLGGNLSQEAVRRDPERYGALIVIGATWNTGPVTRVERALLASAAPMLRLIPARSFPAMMAKASAVTPAGVADAERAFALVEKSSFIDTWRATASFVRPEPDYRSPIPLTLVRGAEDGTGNIAEAMGRWARAEGVTERVVAGAGHLVMTDAPEETSRILLEALTA